MLKWWCAAENETSFFSVSISLPSSHETWSPPRFYWCKNAYGLITITLILKNRLRVIILNSLPQPHTICYPITWFYIWILWVRRSCKHNNQLFPCVFQQRTEHQTCYCWNACLSTCLLSICAFIAIAHRWKVHPGTFKPPGHRSTDGLIVCASDVCLRFAFLLLRKSIPNRLPVDHTWIVMLFDFVSVVAVFQIRTFCNSWHDRNALLHHVCVRIEFAPQYDKPPVYRAETMMNTRTGATKVLAFNQRSLYLNLERIVGWRPGESFIACQPSNPIYSFGTIPDTVLERSKVPPPLQQELVM